MSTFKYERFQKMSELFEKYDIAMRRLNFLRTIQDYNNEFGVAISSDPTYQICPIPELAVMILLAVIELYEQRTERIMTEMGDILDKGLLTYGGY